MRFLFGTLAATLILGGGLVAWGLPDTETRSRDLAALTGNVERGAYIARLSGCIACHTNQKQAGGVLAGGAPIETGFGTFRAPNITPHRTDGIGSWTLDDFSTALTEGKNPEGEYYYPAFPYAFYARLSDQDIVDLWAAVRSVPAVSGDSSEHDIAFPFSVREGIAVWRMMNFDPQPLEQVAGKSDIWHRGRYIARAAAHCGACHTPRDVFGGRKLDERFTGGEGPDGSKAPEIIGETLESRGWTREDLIYTLRTGVTPKGDVFGGAMREVVRDGTRYWSDSDLAALVEYLYDPESGK